MLNTITICGRICNDIELKATTSGTEVVSFTVACERDFKDKDGNKQADFIDCVAFKNNANFLSKFFSKGRMAIVNGKLQTRTWEDKDGNKRKSVEIIVDNVYFGDSKSNQDNAENGSQGLTNNNTEFSAIDPDADLPF